MPYSKEHRQKTRQRILDSAGRLFTRKGYDAVSIDDLMRDAGLTRGAFYHHFADKDDVYATAILSAARQSPIAAHPAADDPVRWLHGVLDAYLSHEHIEHADTPCPLAFLATDINNRQGHARKAYTRAYQGLVHALASRLDVSSDEISHDTAMAISALMIGGVAIGRALDDRAMAEQLLGSCRRLAKRLIPAKD